jgi:hypothetical protein
MLIVTITDTDGEAQLIAPLVKCNDGWLRIAGYKRGDYNTILWNKQLPEVFNQFQKWIIQHNYKLELSNQHEKDLTYTLLRSPFIYGKDRWFRYQYLKHFSKEPFSTIKVKNDCPYIPLSEKESVLTKIAESSSHRQRIKTLSKNGELVYRKTFDSGEIRSLLSALFQMHINEWAEKNEKSLFTEESNKHFYELMTQYLSEGSLRLDLLYLNASIIAMHFGFEDGETVYYYKPCYDPTWQKQSAGAVLLNFIITDTLNKNKSFDFLKGSETYKNYYTQATQTLRQMRIQPGIILKKFTNL